MVLDGLGQRQCLLEIRARVSPGNPTMTSVDSWMPGSWLAERGHEFEVVLAGVPPAHPREHFGRPRLHRQVDVLADLR